LRLGRKQEKRKNGYRGKKRNWRRKNGEGQERTIPVGTRRRGKRLAKEAERILTQTIDGKEDKPEEVEIYEDTDRPPSNQDSR